MKQIRLALHERDDPLWTQARIQVAANMGCNVGDLTGSAILRTMLRLVINVHRNYPADEVREMYQ